MLKLWLFSFVSLARFEEYVSIFPWYLHMFLNLHQIVTAIYKRKNSNISLFFWNFYFSFEIFSQRNGYESFFHATHKHEAYPVKSLNPLSIQKRSVWDLEQRKVLTYWHHMANRCPYSIIKYSENVWPKNCMFIYIYTHIHKVRIFQSFLSGETSSQSTFFLYLLFSAQMYSQDRISSNWGMYYRLCITIFWKALF